jgi:phospholipase C
MKRLAAGLTLGLVALQGCSTSQTASIPARGPSAHRERQPAGSSSPIEHVVVIIQENRSVDNLFNGYPKANTVTSGLDSHGKTIQLQPEDLDSPYDILHTRGSFQTEFADGKLDGFDKVKARTFNGKPYYNKYFAYGYVPKSQVVPYWTMAQQYVLSDNTFQSNGGPSFPAHLYLISGQADNVVGNASGTPWGCDAPRGTKVPTINPKDGKPGPSIAPCFDTAQIATTMGQELDAAGLTWRYYAPAVGTDFGANWSAYDAIKAIRYGPDWSKDVISPETQILEDVRNGELSTVTWVVPSAANSDHGGINTGGGPSWVASVVNAVGASKFWNTTAIFVIWDDWGGWYEHVAPPQYDYEGNGFRVPLIAISPYALQGVVSHTQHESASILKFIENRFGVPEMAAADTRASDLTEMFDFTQKPRPFQSIPQDRRTEDLIRASESDHRAPDDD